MTIGQLTFLTYVLPKPKLKRSFNIPLSNCSNDGNQPFEIQTKTIEDCALLIVNQSIKHQNQSRQIVYNIDH